MDSGWTLANYYQGLPCYVYWEYFVHGGVTVDETAIVNQLLEYLHDSKQWVDLTTLDTPAAVDHIFHYMPHMKSLVIVGGASNEGNRDSKVNIYDLVTHAWTEFATPTHFVPSAGISIPGPIVLRGAASVVFKDTICIVCANWDTETRLVKIIFDANSRTPTFQHHGIESSAIPAEARHQTAVLIGPYALFWGGQASSPLDMLALLSLC